MAKISIIVRENKKKKLTKKYNFIRFFFKKKINKIELSKKLSKKMKRSEIHKKLRTVRNFPRNSSFTRLTNRCSITGRPRSCYKYFRQSRHFLIENFNLCLLPGTKKSNW
uniref:ribosomal protein S14 n=1 Tax=Hydnora abyssinica TaxID=470280 RepID=UPI0021147DC0|nr:ribosomal protein S14 [Hydnora abyssinica]USN93585.1 ribosomal protein S14 [Hydnora abyssinica]